MSSITEWQEIEPDTIWVRRYLIRLFFMGVHSRTTIIRLSDSTLFIHSPCDQVLIRGNRIITEVAFFHKRSNTLILVDLIEYLTDATLGVGWQLKFWWKVSRMWNHPKPAPEYQIGWKDRNAAALSLKRILSWNFNRIIIAHGDLILANAKYMAYEAWDRVLPKRHGVHIGSLS